MRGPGARGSGAVLLAALVAWTGAAGAGAEEHDDEDRRAVLTAEGGEGDPDYGAYLVQECTACHVAGGAMAVPAIDGIAPGYFRLAMEEYARGERENAAMANVARSLGDEELAALAAYFAIHATED